MGNQASKKSKVLLQSNTTTPAQLEVKPQENTTPSTSQTTTVIKNKNDSRPAGTIPLTELPSQDGPYLPELPEEILCSVIFSFLTPQALCLVTLTCKTFQALGERTFKELCTKQAIEKGKLKSYKEAFLQLFTGYSGLYNFSENCYRYDCAILQNVNSINSGNIMWCKHGSGHFSDDIEVLFGTFTVGSTEIHNKNDRKIVLEVIFNFRSYAWEHSRGDHSETQEEVNTVLTIDLQHRIPTNGTSPIWTQSFVGRLREDRLSMANHLSVPDIIVAEKKWLTDEYRKGSAWTIPHGLTAYNVHN